MRILSSLRRLNYQTKISLSIIAVLLLFAVSLSIIISRTIMNAMVAENNAHGVSNALNLAARASEPLLALDLLQLKSLVNEVVQNSKNISYAFIQDRDGQTLVHTFTGEFPVDLSLINPVAMDKPYSIRLLESGDDQTYDVAAPVVVAGDRIGTARLGVSKARVQAMVDRLLLAIFVSTAIGILVAGFLATRLSSTVTRGIRQLHRSAEEVIKGNLDIQTTKTPRRFCWEITKCDKKQCPAYGDIRQRCWYLVGTLCSSCADGKYEKKITNCRFCPVFSEYAGDEVQHLAEFFDIMVLTLNDRLHALKENEEILRHQKQLFTTILDATPDLVFLKDQDQRYRAVNRAFCAFLGKSAAEVIGTTDTDLFPPGLARDCEEEDREVLERSRTLGIEKTLPGLSGNRWHHLIKTPVLGGDGRAVGVLCTARDITEMKEMQERIIRSQRIESLGQLAAGVAHEINTPLGIILGYTQLMLDDAPDRSDTQKSLRIVEKYVRVCRAIVADLSHFARHTESVKRPLDINTILEQVINVVDHTYQLDNVTIERRFQSGMPQIYGDQQKLEQVMMNLLSNAHDAIGSNGQITVTTSYDPQTVEVLVAVADTGQGIPHEIQDKIFDPFFTTKGVGKGTGLGLAVTSGIIRDHGGRIELRSPVPSSSPTQSGPSGSCGGTVFVIHLSTHAGQAEQEEVARRGEHTGA